MGIIKKLYSYVSRYRLTLFLLIIISLFGVAFEILKPLPIKAVIDNVLSNHPVPPMIGDVFGNVFLFDKTSLLFLCIGFMILILIGSAVLSAFVFNLTISLSQKLVYDLSIDFFSKLQRLSLSFHAKNRIGDLLNRMNGDVFIVYFLVAQ